MSMLLNPRDPLSMLLNPRDPLSMLLNPRDPLSMLLNPRDPLSTVPNRMRDPGPLTPNIQFRFADPERVSGITHHTVNLKLVDDIDKMILLSDLFLRRRLKNTLL